MTIIGNGSVRWLVLVAALTTGLGFGAHASAQDHSYPIDPNTETATSLGDTHASAINDTGQVAGWIGPPPVFLTGPGGMGMGMPDLGTPGGNRSEASGINAAGHHPMTLPLFPNRSPMP